MEKLTTKDLEMLMDKNGNLDLSNKHLNELPSLPEGLKILNCSNNNLTSLPPLPEGLKELSCWYNKSLRNLSELELPKTLQRLCCDCFELNDLPILPENLNDLQTSSDYLVYDTEKNEAISNSWDEDVNLIKRIQLVESRKRKLKLLENFSK